MTGGGARAAYQVGFLLAVAKLSSNRRHNPFPILCGTSAAAINAAADPLGIGASGARWLSMLVLGWLIRNQPRSLLDNSPLDDLLRRNLDFSGIQRSIDKGALHAISITASGYESGESISFFEAHPSAHPWRRVQRLGIRSKLGVEHLLASSAIPFVFPPTRIHREFFGDGSMRQLAPISPAIHLRMQRINQTLSSIPPDIRLQSEIPLRPVKTLIIYPSERLDRIAAEHATALPWAVKVMLTGIGAMNRRGGALTSYLLFERPYTRALIDLGYADTMARDTEVGDFLGL